MNRQLKTLAIWVATSTTVEAQVQVHFPTGKPRPAKAITRMYVAQERAKTKGYYNSCVDTQREQIMADIRAIRAQIREMARKPLVNHQATQKLMEDIAMCLQTKPLNNKLSIDMDEIVKL
jgi:hypothetical protein